MDKVIVKYMWKSEMSEMTMHQLRDELDQSLKSFEYFEELLELAEAGDVVDEHVVDFLRTKHIFWVMRRDSCRLAMREREQAAHTPSVVAAH
jgi:hypothetical protein